MAAKLTATQSAPAPLAARSTPVRSKAKLKVMMVSRAKTAMPPNISFVRTSLSRSFHATA